MTPQDHNRNCILSFVTVLSSSFAAPEITCKEHCVAETGAVCQARPQRAEKVNTPYSSALWFTGCLKMCVFALYCVHQEVADPRCQVLLNICSLEERSSPVRGVIRERSVHLSACHQLLNTPVSTIVRNGAGSERLLMFQDNKDPAWCLKKVWYIYAWFYLLIQRQLQPGGVRQELTRQDSTRCGVFIFQLGFLHYTNASCIIVCWNAYRKRMSPYLYAL